MCYVYLYKVKYINVYKVRSSSYYMKGRIQTMKQHNISLDDESVAILNNQKRGFNLSGFIREALKNLEVNQAVGKNLDFVKASDLE